MLFDEKIMEEMFTGEYDNNMSTYNEIAYQYEQDAVAGALSGITSDYKLYRILFKDDSIIRFDENKNLEVKDSDLKKGAYCIVTMKGKPNEITFLLSSKNPKRSGTGFCEKVLTVRDNTGNIILFRDEVLERKGIKLRK